MPASPAYVQEFIHSLPAPYRAAFQDAAMAEHAALSLRRRDQPAVVAAFDAPREGGQALCVIADDRPGLLALIGAALVQVSLEVIDAVAYTRRTPTGASEAVDVFWVVPSGDAPEALARRLEAALVELLTGRRRADTSAPTAGAASGATTVRFIEDASGALCTLEVETGDRSGLLLALANALFAQRVQIVGSELRTSGGRVFDRFQLTELDGSAIGSERRLTIQIAVLSAVQPAR